MILLTFMVLAFGLIILFLPQPSPYPMTNFARLTENLTKLLIKLVWISPTTGRKRDTCPPKPTSLERDPRTSESLVPGVDPGPPIRINVPTLANTGSANFLIEGSGYIPREQVRVAFGRLGIFIT